MEPDMSRNSFEFMSMCLIVLLAVADLDRTADLDVSLSHISGYSREVVGQVLANLESGGALKRGELALELCKSLGAEGGGIALAMLANVADGKMKYNQRKQTFALTANGKRYVETNLL